MSTTCKELQSWVDEMASLTSPDKIYWCNGSTEEYDGLVKSLCDSGEFMPLNKESYPGCYLYRSAQNDVARTENLTFVCTKNRDDAGPNNNWMEPTEAHKLVDSIFEGSMKGRTMYVIPYVMGPIDSPYSRCGVEITDSAYVVVNMHLMTRTGSKALKRIEQEGKFVKGLHSTADLDPEKRYIMHFPEELTIKSVGTGYGGNALLGKKCHSLRIGSWQAKTEGWLAEHMVILGIENPQGEVSYVAAAFPSGCGKTNLAMLIPPESLKGYKIWTLGDDIAWLHVGEDGQMWAINPEAGFFGIVPGTNEKTNYNAFEMIHKDTIFTNVAVTKNGIPWWEGESEKPPKDLFDWQGAVYDPQFSRFAAHPNSRFTISCKQCASYSPKAEDPKGVPISAIIFGGRRKETTPLVLEAKSWAHGVLVGAAAASETTAAATMKVGTVRRDPMAMKPFCGYNFGDYWSHWLSFPKRASKLPKIFHVNWFRKDENDKFLWPGYGENLRVLLWMLDRCKNEKDAVDTPIGFMPKEGDINVSGLDISASTMQKLLSFDRELWKKEYEDIAEFFETFGKRMPQELLDERKKLYDELVNK